MTGQITAVLLITYSKHLGRAQTQLHKASANQILDHEKEYTACSYKEKPWRLTQLLNPQSRKY